MYTFADKANAMKAEYDGRHPKSRMTLMAFLAEAGVAPSPETVDDYMGMVNKLIDFVYAESDDFFNSLHDLDNEQKDQPPLPLGIDNDVEDIEFGGPYL